MKATKILLIDLIFLSICFIGVSFAHDTDLYMASGEGIEPNILIMFDNSGSMDESVLTRTYSNSVTYDPLVVPTANRDTVYRRQSGSYSFFANSIADVACANARTALTNTGHYSGGTQSNCGGPSRTLWTGNYRNYIASGGDQAKRKIDIAKEVMTDFLTAINGVRIGAMVFNNNEGGRIQTTIKSLTDTGRAQLITDFNAITPETWTPLSETLYEAGLYFKGAASYFNSGVTYTSPIEYSCQRNYVIIITDGEPTYDQNNILATAIGDRDGDHREPIGAVNDPHYPSYGSDYLDDVARYLYDTDLRTDMNGTQNVVTYTIGFTVNNDLLNRTAQQGHGKYFYSQNAQELASAFQNIIDEILSKTSSFVAPVVPVSRMERTQSGDKIYLALFKPVSNRMWSGNIKKYGIAQQYSSDNTIRPGDIIDANGQLALDTSGQFYETAHSFWTSSGVLDGGDAEKGGVGEVLMNRDYSVFDPSTGKPRNIYTYLKSDPHLANPTNRFDTTNITPSMLGLGSDSDPAAQSARDKLIKFVYGYDAYDDDGNGVTDEKKDWILGAFLHSRPLVIHYGTSDTSQSVVFAGSNDGMLHAFDDSSGAELWGFIPPDLVNKLHALHEDVLESFVDGSPKAYVTRDISGTITKAILVFGERRGGNRYYALDVTIPSAPKYLWEINPDLTGSPYAEMGQTWSTPYVGKIAYGTGEKWVAFVGGGYDDGQDNAIPPADVKGRAVYVIDVLDGSLIKRFSNAEIPGMTYSFPSDIMRIDTDDDLKIDRLYVGDMGGRMWRFDIGNTDPASWTAKIIFTGASGTKIFYSPDVTMEMGGYEMLFFGTGDRENPKGTSPVDRLYAIKDKNPSTSLTESNLYDVTSDELQADGTTAARKAEILQALLNSNGWFIQLLPTSSGEKCLSNTVVIAKTAFYTTFTPGAGGETDPCHVGEGVGRVYVVQYQTGEAVFNFDLSNDTGGQKILRKEDRSLNIGYGIPSGVVVTFVGGKAVGYIGVGGGVAPITPEAKQIEQSYWRIVF